MALSHVPCLQVPCRLETSLLSSSTVTIQQSLVSPSHDATLLCGCTCCGWPPHALHQTSSTCCRLVYDDKGHFQSYGAADDGENGLEFYDYDETEPAGCQRGLEAQFLLGSFPRNTAWADIPVNKAAFWVGPAAAAMWKPSGGGQPALRATSVQPLLCRAVPARESANDGSIYNLFPVASEAVAAVLAFMLLLTLSLLCCSACARGQTHRQQQKRQPSATSLTPQQSCRF